MVDDFIAPIGAVILLVPASPVSTERSPGEGSGVTLDRFRRVANATALVEKMSENLN